MALNLGNADVQAGTGATPVVTADANSQVTLLKVTAVNTDTVARTLSVYRIPNGGAASDANAIMELYAIGPKSTVVLPVNGQVLVAGQSLSVLADVAAKITVSASFATSP